MVTLNIHFLDLDLLFLFKIGHKTLSKIEGESKMLIHDEEEENGFEKECQ